MRGTKLCIEKEVGWMLQRGFDFSQLLMKFLHVPCFVGERFWLKMWLTLYIYGIFTHSSGLLQLFFNDRLRGRGDKDSFIIYKETCLSQALLNCLSKGNWMDTCVLDKIMGPKTLIWVQVKHVMGWFNSVRIGWFWEHNHIKPLLQKWKHEQS